MSEIVMIRSEDLYEHPDNPRKNLGDLTELTKSISANGILQNLTVVPGHWRSKDIFVKDAMAEGMTKSDAIAAYSRDMAFDSTGYTVVIGHRRRAAGLAAGLKEFPCIISGMDERQQFITMLEENMQREDLTIQEQAYGFQLMFDWGESIRDIADRSGFSEQTVKHRIEIAKLDKKVLKAAADKDLQLTIKDYIELEKIKDIKRREKVLGNIQGREYLHNAVSREIEAEKHEAQMEKAMPLLKEAGVKPAKSNAYMRWSSEYVLVKKFKLKKIPKKLELKDVKPEDKLYWEEACGEIGIYKLDPESRRKSATEENEKKARKEQRKKELREITDSMCADVRNLIEQIYKGEITSIKNEQETFEEIWACWMNLNQGLYSSSVYEITGKISYQLDDTEKKKIREKVADLPVSTQFLVILRSQIYSNSFATTDYQGKYMDSVGKRFSQLHDMLKDLYGFGWSHPDAAKVADGTHELYIKDEEE